MTTRTRRYCYGHTTGEVRRHLVRGVITCTDCRLTVATSRQVAVYIERLRAKARQRFVRRAVPKIYRTFGNRPYNSRKAPKRKRPCAGRDIYGGKNPRRCPHCGKSHERQTGRVKRSPAGKLKRATR